MLEDDYQRYLWDGAVTAAGANPYAVSPQAARALGPATALGRLAVEAGPARQAHQSSRADDHLSASSAGELSRSRT